MNVKPLFKLMVEKKASDLFFAPYTPAKIKIEGKIMPVNKLERSRARSCRSTSSK
jgi:twitching motility protein PilU